MWICGRWTNEEAAEVSWDSETEFEWDLTIWIVFEVAQGRQVQARWLWLVKVWISERVCVRGVCLRCLEGV